MTGKPVKERQSKKELFHLKLPADSENLEIVRNFIGGIVSNMTFSEEEVYQIELAVDEACSNVIKHAYVTETTEEKNITICVETGSDRIVIKITDKGVGFNPEALRKMDMDKYLKQMKPGGLGIHLIRTLMDEVLFHINPGVQNQVKMIKLLPKK